MAFLADGDDLHRFAIGNELADVISREARDLGVEATAQTTFGRAYNDQMHVLAACPGHQRRRICAAGDRLGDIGEN